VCKRKEGDREEIGLMKVALPGVKSIQGRH
jgi:hypothetical protein